MGLSAVFMTTVFYIIQLIILINQKYNCAATQKKYEDVSH